MGKQSNTSWESSAKWYEGIVGEKGHYYHQKVILPKILKILDLKQGDSLLDLACGQGILERQVPKEIAYLGVDLSSSLIEEAKRLKKSEKHQFFCSDVTAPLKISGSYSHATIILALQNMEKPERAIANAGQFLKSKGQLVLILNHPCFRIPRMSHWGVDEGKKLQFRRMDAYLSKQKIPIDTHPGKKSSKKTWSFHHPLSSYFSWLQEEGFGVVGFEEWISDKESKGGRARMENRARAEFPLFVALICQKL